MPYMRYSTPLLGRRPVIYVTHSFGGLVLKEMLRQEKMEPAEVMEPIDEEQENVNSEDPHSDEDEPWRNLVSILSYTFQG